MNESWRVSPIPFRHDVPATPASAWREARDRRAASGGAIAQPLALDGFASLVVVAAHPDDESLGAAGAIALAHAARLRVTVVSVTAGARSHPGSPTVPTEEMAVRRRQELACALGILAPRAEVVDLDMREGAIDPARLVTVLVDVIGRCGDSTLLVAPLRHDGHADHDAVGRAASAAAYRTDATLWEYPVWLWHWATPDQVDVDLVRQLPLPEEVRTLKARAVACHESQIRPLSDPVRPGDEAILQGWMLDHFRGGSETFLLLGGDDGALDAAHEENDEPWAAPTSWYEARKRALLLAALPERRYRRAVEVGCSTGVLTRELVTRCDEIVAIDTSAAALARARRRLGGDERVRLVRGSFDDVWPSGELDLVVVSEIGYFLSPARLLRLVELAQGSLSPGGCVISCHWRHPIEGWPLDAAAVGAAFMNHPSVPGVRGRYVETDFEILVFGWEQ